MTRWQCRDDRARVVAMLTFIVRRTLWAALVMFIITVIVFFIFFKTPGVDPARAIAGRNPSPQMLAEVRAQLGLNRPLFVQYGLMMKRHLHQPGSGVLFGPGHARSCPEIFAAAPATLSLVFGATVDLDRDGHRDGRGGRPAARHGSTTPS